MQQKITYIALLRGINVGGHNVKMEVLRNLFSELGYDNVRSYIQSGNIFFDSTEIDKVLLRKKIEKHLNTSLGFTVSVSLRTIEELENILKQDPFKKVTLTPETRFSVLFLAEPSDIDLPLPYKTPDGGYEVVDKTLTELFVVWHLLNGRPGNSYGMLEKKLQVPTTTRFWHTTAKIFDAAKKSES